MAQEFAQGLPGRSIQQCKRRCRAFVWATGIGELDRGKETPPTHPEAHKNKIHVQQRHVQSARRMRNLAANDVLRRAVVMNSGAMKLPAKPTRSQHAHG